MNEILAGATMMASAVVAIFFLRFWRRTGDRLFLMFAIAFAVYGANRLGLSLLKEEEEFRTGLYALRCVAFLIIIVAIVDKNRAGRASTK